MPRSEAQPAGPDWQCVMFLWGDKYDVALVNRLVREISVHSESEPRFVLLSDRARPGLDPNTQLRHIPDFWLHPVFRGPGCQTKLAMFQDGVLEDDLPVLYIDLDTVVTGNLALILRKMPNPQSLTLLQSAILPLGAVGRVVWWLTKGRRYARGNSSLVAFHPKYHKHVAAQFRELWQKSPNLWFRPMIADERFMCWASQRNIARIPNTLAVKFPTEFMSRVDIFSYLWAHLPWVQSRRAGLVAVTLCGVEIKPEQLLDLPEGGRVTDRKGRKLIWSDAVLGRTRRDIIDFYSKVVK